MRTTLPSVAVLSRYYRRRCSTLSMRRSWAARRRRVAGASRTRICSTTMTARPSRTGLAASTPQATCAQACARWRTAWVRRSSSLGWAGRMRCDSQLAEATWPRSHAAACCTPSSSLRAKRRAPGAGGMAGRPSSGATCAASVPSRTSTCMMTQAPTARIVRAASLRTGGAVRRIRTCAALPRRARRRSAAARSRLSYTRVWSCPNASALTWSATSLTRCKIVSASVLAA
mmetsp:Transcript_51895/g.143733  ORF Transcript_51895/g.143733 Transcript_51895/m.143733 type:complete len:230 (-) Transcript_51895:594-1283(-)